MTTPACRAIGCPHPAEPGMAWCIPHQIAHWEGVGHDLRDRFAAQLAARITTNDSGCWLYNGDRNPDTKYAVARHGGRRTALHRWIVWYFEGGLKLGHDVHHICGGAGDQDTRHCIRPAHLVQVRPGDHREITRLRAHMIAVAEPGARFYQTSVGETGATVAFAQAHDLPRHEVERFDHSLYQQDGDLVALWKLFIPRRFLTSDGAHGLDSPDRGPST